MNNRIDQLFSRKNKEILSVYFTAGFPEIDQTAAIIELLEKHGTDLVEIGMPFSDPTADGPTIQKSSDVALKNGMTLEVLFKQLKDIRKSVKMPLILMGYINPVLHYGIERFCDKCRECGIDGLIIPDMPLNEYVANFRKHFEAAGLHNILLVTPQTSETRIMEIDRNSGGFIYMVSSSSTTGAGKKVEDFKIDYFERMQQMNLKNPRLIGFGISDRDTFANACKYSSGAIIGSAFIKALQQEGPLETRISGFIHSVRG